jgi:hypothetical protein
MVAHQHGSMRPQISNKPTLLGAVIAKASIVVVCKVVTDQQSSL